MAVQTFGSKVEEILGSDAAGLLQHQCKTIPKESLHLPGPDYVDRIYAGSDRRTRVLGLIFLLVLAGTAVACIRRVEFSGEMQPIAFEFRWERGADATFHQSHVS